MIITGFLILPRISADSSVSARQTTGNGTRLRILMLNVCQHNTDYTSVRDYLHSVKPDMIALAELDKKWFNELQPVLSEYPYSLYETRNDNFGIGLFSSYSPEHANLEYYGKAGFPTVVASFSFMNEQVSLVFTHPVSPVSPLKWRLRNDQLKQIIPHRKNWHDSLIFLGDLNTTEWSYIYKSLISNLGVFDSRQGFGLHPSWYQASPLFLIPIDHIFLSHNLQVINRSVGSYIGSDHRPVLIEIFVPEKEENAVK